jgi:thioredoxin 2
VREVARRLAGCAAVVQINTQENPNIGGRFGVRGIPALILLRQGRVVDQISGAQPPEAVLAWVNRHVKCR